MRHFWPTTTPLKLALFKIVLSCSEGLTAENPLKIHVQNNNSLKKPFSS